MNPEIKVVLIRSGSPSEERSVCLGKRCDNQLIPSEQQRISQLSKKGFYPKVDRVYTSSLTRCRETAYLAYPEKPAIIATELPAFDYGDLSGNTLKEVFTNNQHKERIEQTGISGAPDGDGMYTYYSASAKGFQSIMEEVANTGGKSVAIITYRETILAIGNRFCVPRSEYRNFNLDFGDFLVLNYEMDLNIAFLENKNIAEANGDNYTAL